MHVSIDLKVISQETMWRVAKQLRTFSRSSISCIVDTSANSAHSNKITCLYEHMRCDARYKIVLLQFLILGVENDTEATYIFLPVTNAQSNLFLWYSVYLHLCMSIVKEIMSTPVRNLIGVTDPCWTRVI